MLFRSEELRSIGQNESHFDFEIANNLSKKVGSYLLNGWDSQSEERKNDFYLWNKKTLGSMIIQYLWLSKKSLICCLGGNGLVNLNIRISNL